MGNFLSLLQKSVEKRLNLQKNTNALRLVNGKADGFPGLTLDKYGEHYQIQFYSNDLMPYEKEICKAVLDLFHPQYFIVKYRLSPSGKSLEKPEMRLVCGSNPETIVQEGSCLFQVNLEDTVNPGLFLDMREIREDIESRSSGANLLNLFSYTCSFGVHARVGGALKAVNVDISGKILEKGRINYKLNNLECLPGEFFKGNAFEYLAWAKKRDKKFDLVVLDPPSFARFKGFSFNVRQDLDSLVKSSASVLTPGGLLMVSSNYSGFNLEGFAEKILQGVSEVTGNAKVLWKRSQASDFVGSGQSKDSSLCAVLVKVG